MATASIADIYWVFNPVTRQVEIVADGVVLEVTTLSAAAARVTFHRNQAAADTPAALAPSSPYKRHNRRAV